MNTSSHGIEEHVAFEIASALLRALRDRRVGSLTRASRATIPSAFSKNLYEYVFVSDLRYYNIELFESKQLKRFQK